MGDYPPHGIKIRGSQRVYLKTHWETPGNRRKSELMDTGTKTILMEGQWTRILISKQKHRMNYFVSLISQKKTDYRVDSLTIPPTNWSTTLASLKVECICTMLSCKLQNMVKIFKRTSCIWVLSGEHRIKRCLDKTDMNDGRKKNGVPWGQEYKSQMSIFLKKIII